MRYTQFSVSTGLTPRCVNHNVTVTISFERGVVEGVYISNNVRPLCRVERKGRFSIESECQYRIILESESGPRDIKYLASICYIYTST